eukprot:PLAT5629.1.p1 GENE.PLAT5629.1~~PLAT5629.1.p1  ORF type:complete len:358 (+),score=82.10 PLAT5629.1:47-1120(+)
MGDVLSLCVGGDQYEALKDDLRPRADVDSMPEGRRATVKLMNKYYDDCSASDFKHFVKAWEARTGGDHEPMATESFAATFFPQFGEKNGVSDMVDADHSGQVDMGEFIGAMSLLKYGGFEEKCMFAFNLFDLDGNGLLEQAELEERLEDAVDYWKSLFSAEASAGHFLFECSMCNLGRTYISNGREMGTPFTGTRYECVHPACFGISVCSSCHGKEFERNIASADMSALWIHHTPEHEVVEYTHPMSTRELARLWAYKITQRADSDRDGNVDMEEWLVYCKTNPSFGDRIERMSALSIDVHAPEVAVTPFISEHLDFDTAFKRETDMALVGTHRTLVAPTASAPHDKEIGLPGEELT